MPGTVITAIVCESILLLLSTVGIVGAIVKLDPCGGVFYLTRVAFEVGAVIGYVKGINAIRWISFGLGCASLLLFLVCGGILAVGGVAVFQNAGVPPERMAIIQAVMGVMIAVMFVGVVLYGTILGCLLAPSARDYFDG